MDEKQKDELRITIAKRLGYFASYSKFKLNDKVQRWCCIVSPFEELCSSFGDNEQEAWGLSIHPDTGELPDWTRSWDDVMTLESEIPEDQRNDYARRLAKIILDDWPMFKTGANVMWWSLAHATPEQRCRAYLAWKEAVQQEATGEK
jgi:hypothetical protein